VRILDLGGPDYARSAPKAQDSEGNEIRGATGKGAGYRRGFRLPPAAPLLAALCAHTSPGAPQRGVALSPAWLSFGLRRTRCGARFLHPPFVLAAAHSCLCSSRAAALHLLQALPAPCRGAARPGPRRVTAARAQVLWRGQAAAGRARAVREGGAAHAAAHAAPAVCAHQRGLLWLPG